MAAGYIHMVATLLDLLKAFQVSRRMNKTI
jgi:hypothetical protein